MISRGGSSSTLGALLDGHIAHIGRMRGAPTTLYLYRRIVATRIGAAPGSKRLDKLTAHDLDRACERGAVAVSLSSCRTPSAGPVVDSIWL
ncbi:MAG: hypothetical protein ACLQOZ_05585 [Acidimicrobiales bacterium]